VDDLNKWAAGDRRYIVGDRGESRRGSVIDNDDRDLVGPRDDACDGAPKRFVPIEDRHDDR
jgi:hypothetical protein